MRVLLSLAFGAILASGCMSRPWHLDAYAFSAEVKDWGLQGKPVSDVLAVLDERGFRCSRPNATAYECARVVESIQCSQTQWLDMTVEPSARVVNAISTRAMADGTLAWRC